MEEITNLEIKHSVPYFFFVFFLIFFGTSQDSNFPISLSINVNISTRSSFY